MLTILIQLEQSSNFCIELLPHSFFRLLLLYTFPFELVNIIVELLILISILLYHFLERISLVLDIPVL